MKKNRILALDRRRLPERCPAGRLRQQRNNNTNPSANPSNDGEGGTTSTLSGKIATGGSTSGADQRYFEGLTLAIRN